MRNFFTGLNNCFKELEGNDTVEMYDLRMQLLKEIRKYVMSAKWCRNTQIACDIIPLTTHTTTEVVDILATSYSRDSVLSALTRYSNRLKELFGYNLLDTIIESDFPKHAEWCIQKVYEVTADTTPYVCSELENAPNVLYKKVYKPHELVTELFLIKMCDEKFRNEMIQKYCDGRKVNYIKDAIFSRNRGKDEFLSVYKKLDKMDLSLIMK